MSASTEGLRVGLVGCGGRGRGLGRELQEAGLGEITALCEISPQSLEIA